MLAPMLFVPTDHSLSWGDNLISTLSTFVFLPLIKLAVIINKLFVYIPVILRLMNILKYIQFCFNEKKHF